MIDMIIIVFLILVLMIISGLVTAFETAFFSLTQTEISELESGKSKGDRRLLDLHEDGNRTMSTILISNAFLKVLIVVLCSYITFNVLDVNSNEMWSPLLLLTVAFILLFLFFGGAISKLYYRKNPLNFCKKNAKLIIFLRKFFWPLETLLLKQGVIAPSYLPKQNLVLSVNDLEQALELTDQEEIKNEQSMLRGIIRFGDETAKEVMTGRKDMIAINIQSNYHEVIQSIIQNNYSRIPVFKDNDDDIRGVLYIKDLLPYLNKPATFRWQSLIRPPYFVPETKKIDDLLSEFKQNKVHIAIVVDEFGGTSGLVTLEDILEEIVGEINDEYDEEVPTYTKIDDKTFIFEGKTLLSDFDKIMEIDADEFEDVEGDADTLAGLLLEIKRDFLSLHEVIHYKRYTFEILEIDERRISRVKVTVDSDKTSSDSID